MEPDGTGNFVRATSGSARRDGLIRFDFRHLHQPTRMFGGAALERIRKLRGRVLSHDDRVHAAGRTA